MRTNFSNIQLFEYEYVWSIIFLDLEYAKNLLNKQFYWNLLKKKQQQQQLALQKWKNKSGESLICDKLLLHLNVKWMFAIMRKIS